METDRLADLVNLKHTVLTQLRDLAQRQLELALAADARGLTSLLAVKQRLLDELMKIEAALNPYRAQQPDDRVWRTPEDRAKCAAVSAQCRVLLTELMDLDRQGSQQLEAQQQQNRIKIDSAHHAASARNAYTANSGATTTSVNFTS